MTSSAKRRRPRGGAVSYAAKVERFVAILRQDRAAGVTLWQVLVMVPDAAENHYAVTSTPERFLTALVHGEVAVPDARPGGYEALGIGVMPLALDAPDDAQLAALLTLPRDRVLTRAEVAAHGVTIHDVPPGPAATMRTQWNQPYR
jgi:hypothetical protein